MVDSENVVIVSIMKLEMDDNQFTCWDILEYLKVTYGCQINGNVFSSSLLHRWIRLKKIPEAYGGHKIINAARFKELGNLLVLTIEGLTRAEVQYIIGSFCNYEETLNKRRKVDVLALNQKPRKQRTKLYFQILEAAGKQYTKKTLPQSMLPLHWKEAGIKKNQLINKSNSKKQSDS